MVANSGNKDASKNYRKFSAYNNTLQSHRLDLIVEEVLRHAPPGQSGGVKLLELGCGIGAISFPLSSLGYQVMGSDIDEKSIAACNAKNRFPDARYVVADAETVDLGEQFDIVVASEIFEHCPHPDLVLKTVDRHLVPGGTAVLTVPNGYCLSEMVFSRLFQNIGIHALFHKLPPGVYKRITGSPTPYYSMNVASHHIHFFTLKRFSRMITAAGFEIIAIRNLDLGLLLDWNWMSPAKRLECRIASVMPHGIAGGWVFVVKRKGEA